MARKLRIEFAGAAYHVMSRGNQGRDIYDDDRDRKLRFGGATGAPGAERILQRGIQAGAW